MLKQSQLLRAGYRWLTQFGDPIKAIRAVRNIGWYVRDWHRYGRMEGAEALRLIDSWPQLHDRTPETPFDAHYFWMGGWAMRRIVAQRPDRHVDVGSQAVFVNLLSAVVPVTFVDYRPLEVQIQGLTCRSGDILNLPFEDQSIQSLSCLHVAEHIGLGRYGDRLNPNGTLQACGELQRVLAPGGHLYFAIPIGKERVCFNGCRIHAPGRVLEFFSELQMVEFCGVRDSGEYVEHVSLDKFADSFYACGMFRYQRVARTPPGPCNE